MKIDESYVARRRFLCGMLGGGTAALGAGVVGPLAAYVGNLREEPPPDFVVLAREESDPSPGEAKSIAYGEIPVLLLRTREPDAELKAFVATCTHLDCNVGYKKDENCIYCACHGGYYDLDGQVIKGPPPLPLRRVYHAMRDGELILALEKENLEKALEESS